MLIHDKEVLAHDVADVFLRNSAITPFQQRQAQFLSSRIRSVDVQDDIKLLLLCMLDNKNRGVLFVGKEHVVSSISTYLKYSQAVQPSGESMQTDMADDYENWCRDDVYAWFSRLFSLSTEKRLLPLCHDEDHAAGTDSALLKCDQANQYIYFQVFGQSRAIVKKKIGQLIGRTGNTIDMASARTTISQSAGICFKGRAIHVRQIAAAYLALKHHFVVISGGPGTGKSTVLHLVVRSLHHYYSIPPERMVLCAPTGRAKSRLSEAISNGLDKNDPLTKVPAYTIHSLLAKNTIGDFKLPDNQTLPYDLVIVDEASMVDLVLFSILLERLPDHCRLILAGDSEQLPPVEAGAVLGDLTGGFTEAGHIATLRDTTVGEIGSICQGLDNLDNIEELPRFVCAEKPPMVDRVVFLTKNYRSDQGIISWWKNSVSGYPVDAHDTPVIVINDRGESGMNSVLNEYVTEVLHHLRDKWDKTLRHRISGNKGVPDPVAFELLRLIISSVKIVCCVNEGPEGRHALNTGCHSLLCNKGGNRNVAGKWVDGQPVVVGRNQGFPEELYNGDTGIVLVQEGNAYGCFPVMNTVRMVPVHRIDVLEPAYAVSVHKAQGSEYDKVIFVLPGKPVRVLSRQLVYTAVTRAKKQLQIVDSAGFMNNIAALPEERRQGIICL